MKQRFTTFLAALFFSLSMALPASATVSDTGYSDVDAGAWYAESVTWCRENNLMAGVGGGRFAPDSTLTRAMLAAVLYRAAGSPSITGNADFSDVAADAYYNHAVNWVSANGIISGYGNRLFGSNDPVTREQIATILWRYDGSPAAERGTDFVDESSIAFLSCQAPNS